VSDDPYGGIRDQLARTRKRERRSTLLVTLLPVVIVIALVLVAGSRLMDANTKLQQVNGELKGANAELQRELGDRDAIVKTLTARIDGLEKDKGDLQAALTKVKTSARPQIQTWITRTIEQSGTETAPTIDLHIAEEGQRDPVRHLQSQYIKTGYLAPGIENVARRGAKIPQQTEVRYFREEDKDEAAKIAMQLAKDGVKAAPVLVQNKTEQPRQFEVWFAKNAAPPKKE